MICPSTSLQKLANGPPILLVVPAKAGDPGQAALTPAHPKDRAIADYRARSTPISTHGAPFLDALFAEDRIGHGFRETRQTPTYVLRNLEQIRRQHSNGVPKRGAQYRL